jgi:hypothetical protein
MATKPARLLHMIQGLEFPDYVYQEYPKAVKSGTLTDGKGNPIVVIVNSKEEEKEAVKREDKPAEEKLPEGQHPAAKHVDKPAKEELPSSKPSVEPSAKLLSEMSEEELEAEMAKRKAAKLAVDDEPAVTPAATVAKPSVTFKPAATSTLQAAKATAEKLAETPGGIAKP